MTNNYLVYGSLLWRAVDDPPMRFGVLGTAAIADRVFIPALESSDHGVAAIASRELARAERVAAAHGIDEAYGSYGDLLEEADVDAIYVPLPNSLHAEWSKRAADHGFHVLCEKPLACSAEEALETGAYCDERGVTLMEAVMYRYHPRTERLVEILADELGEIRSVTASFHSALRHWPVGTRMDPAMGGGSLLDVGVYAIAATRLALGMPERAVARSVDTAGTGVDTQLKGILEFESGAQATIGSSFDAADAQYFRVEGTEGWLRMEPAYSVGELETSIEYESRGRRVEETFPAVNHFRIEADRFAGYVERGERPLTDATDAARTLAVVDALRESAGTGDEVAVDAP